MTELVSKNGWSRVTFGEMAEHVAERVEPTPDDSDTYVGLEHLDAGSLTVRRWGADITLVGTKLRMRNGDILFARRNAYLRRVALAPHDGLFSAHGMVLRARPHVALPEFLPFFMQSDLFMDRAERISVGSLSPTVNWETLKAQEFVLPPLVEQRRIAAVLGAAERASESLLDVEQASRQCHRAFVDAYLAYGANQASFTGQSPSLRPGWRYVQIDDLCEQIVDCLHRTPRYQDSGYPAIRTEDVVPGRLNWEGAYRVSEGDYQQQISRLAPRHNDVLFSREGGRLGIAALVPPGVQLCISQRMMHLRARPGLPGHLLMEYLNSSWVQRQVTMLTDGSAAPHLNVGDVRRFSVPLPPDEDVDSFASRASQLLTAAEVTRTRSRTARELASRLRNRFLEARVGLG